MKRAEEWRWSSLWRREYENEKAKRLLSPLPFELPVNYLASVNDILDKEKLEIIRTSVNKGRPYGSDGWQEKMIDTFSLLHTLRGVGRPRK